MDALLWIVLLSGLLAAAGLAMELKYGDYRYRSTWRGRGLWLLIPFGLVFLVTGFVSVIIYPSRSVGRTTCRHFSEQSGYPTKFVILNWADTGTCLARTPDGHWTKNTNIIVNVPSKR
jgi:hypothetical protein